MSTPLCPIWDKPLELETSKTEGTAAVHEHCYIHASNPLTATPKIEIQIEALWICRIALPIVPSPRSISMCVRPNRS
jgi:hypothetical protein